MKSFLFQKTDGVQVHVNGKVDSVGTQKEDCANENSVQKWQKCLYLLGAC